MSNLTSSDFPDAVSTPLEAEVSPQERVRLGSLLADMGRRAKLTDEEFAVFEQLRSSAPVCVVNAVGIEAAASALAAQRRRAHRGL